MKVFDPVAELQKAADEVKERAAEWIGSLERQKEVVIQITVNPRELTTVAVVKEYHVMTVFVDKV